MSKFENDKWKKAVEMRLDDFDKRKKYWINKEPSAVKIIQEFGWEYICQYILADDTYFLEKYNVAPESCKHIDIYWKFDGDVAFVEIASSDVQQMRFTARWESEMLYLAADEPDRFVTSKTVELVLKQLWKIHSKENLVQKFYLKRKYRVVN